MADKKISELTALTGANVATDDQLVIVDTSAALTKSITIDEFKNALDTATGFVRITGDTMTGDLSMSGANITLGDSSGVSDDRIVLGDDSDLLIYHNNPNSFIRDQGNGNFFITTDGNYIFLAKDDLTNMATFQVDGPVDLYHAGSAKLATTSTGVDITGTLTSDGLTVGSTSYSSISTSEAPTLSTDAHGGEALWLRSGGTSGLGNVQAVLGFGKADGASARTGAAIASIQTDADADRVGLAFYRSGSSASVQTMAKSVEFSHNGNISFFEDTGTTAKFFWSAADERLGLGSTTPSASLHLPASSASTYANGIFIGAGTGDLYGLSLWHNTSSNTTSYIDNRYDNAAAATKIRMRTQGTPVDAMTILGSGNVGIGTDSPQARFQVSQASNLSLTNSDAQMRIEGSGYTGFLGLDATSFQIGQNSNLRSMTFHSGSGMPERMRIDSSGNLLVGLTSISDATSRAYGNAFSGSSSNPNWKSWGSGAHTHAQFRNGTSVVGSITTTSSATTYNTSSDHRLKENVVDLTGATTRLKQLEPKRFNFIADADTTVDGFIAHEVQSVVPEAITGEHNEVDGDGNPVYQGIDQSKLVPLLVATIKELEARITALENA